MSPGRGEINSCWQQVDTAAWNHPPPPSLQPQWKGCVAGSPPARRSVGALTEEPCNLIGLLLLNLLIVQSFKEDVQDQYILPAEETERSTQRKTAPFVCIFKSQVVSQDTRWLRTHFLCDSLVIVTLKVNDGDPGHAMQRHHPSTEKTKKKKNQINSWLTAAERHLPDVLLSFVEFLSQIFSRGLTGDLNHGQLLAIASHVAGGLTHTVIVVFLYQKVCGWSKSFKTIWWSQPAHKKPFLCRCAAGGSRRSLPSFTFHGSG